MKKRNMDIPKKNESEPVTWFFTHKYKKIPFSFTVTCDIYFKNLSQVIIIDVY